MLLGVGLFQGVGVCVGGRRWHRSRIPTGGSGWSGGLVRHAKYATFLSSLATPKSTMPTGSCLCGDVAFEITGPVEQMGHCHCSMCRKFHGSAFATFGVVAPGRFSLAARRRQGSSLPVFGHGLAQLLRALRRRRAGVAARRPVCAGADGHRGRRSGLASAAALLRGIESAVARHRRRSAATRSVAAGVRRGRRGGRAPRRARLQRPAPSAAAACAVPLRSSTRASPNAW